MKRFHVHLHVADLQASIAFYSRLFAAQPARVEADYAKWMIDDPRVNFAISTRGAGVGLDHLGVQAEDAAELAELKAGVRAAELALVDEGATTCCYAASDKHWIIDPDGLPWEHFQTLGQVKTFGGAVSPDAVCCAPAVATTGDPAMANTAVPSQASCCAPAVGAVVVDAAKSGASCCAPAASTSCCAPAKPLATADKPRVRAACCAPAAAGTAKSCC